MSHDPGDPGGGAKERSRYDPLYDPELDDEPGPSVAPAMTPAMAAELRAAMAAAAEPFDPTGPALPSEAKVYAGPATPPPRHHKTVEMVKVRIADRVDPRRAPTVRIEPPAPKPAVAAAVVVATPPGGGAPERTRRRWRVLGALGAGLLVVVALVGLQRPWARREGDGAGSTGGAASGALEGLQGAAPRVAPRASGSSRSEARGAGSAQVQAARKAGEPASTTGDGALIQRKPEVSAPAPKPIAATPPDDPARTPRTPAASPGAATVPASPRPAPVAPAAPAASAPRGSWF